MDGTINRTNTPSTIHHNGERDCLTNNTHRVTIPLGNNRNRLKQITL